MSIRATEYALDCLERDRRLTTTARAVFLALAVRANSQTGTTYTGGWLVDAIGGHFVTVRRALQELVRESYIGLEHRNGKASIVRFPAVSPLSTTPRVSAQGRDVHTPRVSAPTPRASARDVSGPVSGHRNSPDTRDCACEGTGWLYDEAANRSSRCPVCTPPRRAYA